MIESILIGVGSAVAGGLSGWLGFIVYKRKNTAEAAQVELTNEKQVREIYKPIIDDLRQHIDEENKRCAERLAEVYAEVDNVKGRLKLIENNCVGGCFDSKIRIHK
jgi:hypothetical protein